MKRFTDTNKWRDPWFQGLNPLTKVAFEYIRDNCDSAGVWDPIFKLADFSIGCKIDWTEVKKEFSDRLVVLENGKWLLTKFIKFQYGTLSEACIPHKRVLSEIKSHGLLLNNDKSSIDLIDTTCRVETTQQEEEEEEREDKVGKGGMGERDSQALEIYSLYPKKVGKKEALRAIVKSLQKFSFQDLRDKTKTYSIAREDQDPNFTPHPATWFNGERFNDDPSTWSKVKFVGPAAPVQIGHTGGNY